MRNLIDDEIKKKSNDEHNEKSRTPKKLLSRGHFKILLL